MTCANCKDCVVVLTVRTVWLMTCANCKDCVVDSLSRALNTFKAVKGLNTPDEDGFVLVQRS